MPKCNENCNAGCLNVFTFKTSILGEFLIEISTMWSTFKNILFSFVNKKFKISSTLVFIRVKFMILKTYLDKFFFVAVLMPFKVVFVPRIPYRLFQTKMQGDQFLHNDKCTLTKISLDLIDYFDVDLPQSVILGAEIRYACTMYLHFFKKWAKPGLFLFIFVLFT